MASVSGTPTLKLPFCVLSAVQQEQQPHLNALPFPEMLGCAGRTWSLSPSPLSEGASQHGGIRVRLFPVHTVEHQCHRLRANPDSTSQLGALPKSCFPRTIPKTKPVLGRVTEKRNHGAWVRV